MPEEYMTEMIADFGEQGNELFPEWARTVYITNQDKLYVPQILTGMSPVKLESLSTQDDIELITQNEREYYPVEWVMNYVNDAMKDMLQVTIDLTLKRVKDNASKH